MSVHACARVSARVYSDYLHFNQFHFVYHIGHRAAVLTWTPDHVRPKIQLSANRSALQGHCKVVEYFRKMFLKGKQFIRYFKRFFFSFHFYNSEIVFLPYWDNSFNSDKSSFWSQTNHGSHVLSICIFSVVFQLTVAFSILF